MAEGIAKAFFRGGSSIQVSSAGLYGVPGTPPFHHAVQVCAAHGIYIASHRAQALNGAMVARADIVYGMERGQCDEVAVRFPGVALVRLIGEGVPDIPDEISDPYGEGIEVFEQTFSYLTRAIAFHGGCYKEGRRHDREAEAFG